MAMNFNPAPGWPSTPAGWTPPPGWTPDPSWPPAPEGWQFWVEDSPAAPAATPEPRGGADAPTTVFPAVAQEGAHAQAPPTVPYAEYSHQGGSQQFHQPGGSDDEPTKKNHRVWLIPVGVVAVLGMVFAGLALAGVFSSDDEKPEATTTPTPTPTPTPSPSAEPTAAATSAEAIPTPSAPGAGDDTPALEGFEGLDDLGGFEGLEELEQLLTAEKSTDPATPKFCAAFKKLEENSATFNAENPTIDDLNAAIRQLEGLNPPAELASDWAEYIKMMRKVVDTTTASGGSVNPDELNESLLKEEGLITLAKVGGFIGLNCESSL